MEEGERAERVVLFAARDGRGEYGFRNVSLAWLAVALVLRDATEDARDLGTQGRSLVAATRPPALLRGGKFLSRSS